MNLLIYKSEIEDGLAEALDNNTIAYCTQIKSTEDRTIANDFKSLFQTEANESIDLHPLNTILVSTGWNKNSDIFDKYETWAARKTPIHKPLNVGHDHNKIRGHITSSVVVDDKGQIIADDSSIDEVPDFFHILTGAFLYKKWKPSEIETEMENIIAEINNGEWYVSMECLFRGFDYGLIDLDGTNRVIARDGTTAFLTKHLRCYGGSGEYEGRKIGRVLRNITFSGKGLVRNPANPHSIIITDKFNGTKASIDDIGEKMSKEDVDKAIDKVSELTVSLTEASTKLANSETENKNLKDVVSKAEADKKIVEAKLSEVETVVASQKTQIDELTKKLTEAEAKVVATSEELGKIRAEAKKTSRISALKEKGKTAEEAEALFTKFENLDDKTFAEVLSLVAMKEEKEEVKKDKEDKKDKKSEASELDTLKVEEPPLTVVKTEAETVETANATVVKDLIEYFNKSKKSK